MISWPKVIVGVLLVVLIVFFIVYQAEINNANDNVFGEKQFEITKGQGVSGIVDNLVTGGFLTKPFWFKTYVFLHGYRSQFVDGKFAVRTDLNIKNLVKTLLSKDNNKEVEIKILEGWNVGEIDKYLSGKGLVKSGELVDYSNSFNNGSALAQIIKNRWDFLKDRPINASLEGYFYPDTYRVYSETMVEEIAAKMLNNFNRKLTPELTNEIKKQGKDLNQIIILASIVEKEMFGYENRQKVADIFWKRLAAGMALQSDATVNYVTKKGVASPSADDIRVDSRYNTYKYPGLPPGPICNPSIEAIKAVIHPEKTPYWYFLTTPEGQMIFSKTHDEHVTNKQKYLN